MTTIDTETLREKVQAMYSQVARNPHEQFHFETGRALASSLGYPETALDRVPPRAVDSFAGVGYFFDLAGLRDGETVLDLGSGSGMDAFVAAVQVSPRGRVIGIDITPDQLAQARMLATERGIGNATFEEGRIEQLPLEDSCIDAVISNGVINLVPDKELVFREAARVLRPGGRLAIADIVTDAALTDAIVADVDLWASCIGGAPQQATYLEMLERAGLRVARVKANPYEFLSTQARAASERFGVKSVSVLAQLEPAT